MAKKNRRKPKNKQQNTSQQANVIEKTPVAVGKIAIQFHPIDTWFFRESRPHDAAGASELSSLFPPPIRTLAGALRTFLGDMMEIDWKTLQCQHHDFDFEKSLGNAEHLGELQLNGPWINHQGQRLYPAPLYLMQKENKLQRLRLGQPVQCDLGRVRLPTMSEKGAGYKGLEQHWITATGMRQCLQGELPTSKDLICREDLFCHEARLGIARNNQTRKVIDGQLYQTQHLRLKEGVHIELEAKKLTESVLNSLNDYQQGALLRLGGEGRMAGIKTSTEIDALPFSKPQKSDKLLIHFITPADFNGQMFPDNFQKVEQNEQTVWQGEINGIALIIEAAIIGKAHREGGWDMQNHQPRPVNSYIPAGSVWFCRLQHPNDNKYIDEKLHGHCIGADSAYGRGQILTGQWQEANQ